MFWDLCILRWFDSLFMPKGGALLFNLQMLLSDMFFSIMEVKASVLPRGAQFIASLVYIKKTPPFCLEDKFCSIRIINSNSVVLLRLTLKLTYPTIQMPKFLLGSRGVMTKLAMFFMTPWISSKVGNRTWTSRRSNKRLGTSSLKVTNKPLSFRVTFSLTFSPKLSGGNSNICYFHPENWGKMNPFWRIFCRWVETTD